MMSNAIKSFDLLATGLNITIFLHNYFNSLLKLFLDLYLELNF